MSTGDVPGNTLFWPNSLPERFISSSQTGTSGSYQHIPNVNIPGGQLILGIDFVASGSEPIQLFVNAQGPSGIQFYYDSQSTGEGNGVRFVWRGQLPLHASETLSVNWTASGSIATYCTAWGLVLPYDVYSY